MPSLRDTCLLIFLALPMATLSAAAADASRLAADLARDARDRPEALLDFAGITAGMHVADLFGGGGYFSEWLQRRVGEGGHVMLYNNPAYQRFGQDDQDLRFADGRLAMIERRVTPPEAMGLGESRLDGVLMVMAFHDLYWVDEREGWPAIDRAGFIAQVTRALKPGGVLLVVDHAASRGSGMAAVNPLHRVDEDFVRREIEAQGLRFEAASDALRTPADDHTRHVLDPAIRGHTDRFVLRFRKPG